MESKSTMMGKGVEAPMERIHTGMVPVNPISSKEMAAQVSQVFENMDRLRQEIIVLDEAIQAMTARLAPVLRPEGLIAAPERPEELVPLADELAQRWVHVNILRRRIEDICNRIEL